MELENEQFKYLYEYVCREEERDSGRHNMSFTSEPILETAYGIANTNNSKSVLDICAGNGLFLAKSCEHIKSPVVKGYEINPQVAHFANGYLKLCGLEGDIETADVLKTEIISDYDLVFAEYPFLPNKYDSVPTFKSETIKVETKRVSVDWSFILKAINAISEQGKAIVVASDGALFRAPESPYRKEIVERGLLEAVIKMPQGSLQSVGVSISLLVFSHNNDSVAFIDASEQFELISKRDKRPNVEAILNLWESKNSVCPSDNVRMVSVNEIRENDYYLEASRYMNRKALIELKNSTPLSQVAELVPGYQYTTRTVTELNHGEGNIHVVKISNISDNEIEYESTASINMDPSKVARYILKDKDIVVATKGTAIKAAMFVSNNDDIYVAQSNMTVIRVKDKYVSPEFLLAYINGKTGRSILEGLQKGAAISSISMRDLAEYTIPNIESDIQEYLGDKYLKLKKQKKKLLEELLDLDKEIESLCEGEIY